jgi:hypothetical protein
MASVKAWSRDSLAVGVDHDQLDLVGCYTSSDHLLRRSIDGLERLRGGLMLADQARFRGEVAPVWLHDPKKEQVWS